MQAQKLLPEVSVSEVNRPSDFAALEADWNALSAASGDSVFLRHEFLRVWMDNFAPRVQRRILLARNPAGKLVGALPLVESRVKMFGIPIRQLRAAANTHSCRFDLLSFEPWVDSVAQGFLQHLRSKGGFDLLLLSDVPEGGQAHRLFQAASIAGHPVGTWESLRSPYVPLPKNSAEFAARLSSKFKANCRRRRKKLEEKGDLRWEKVTGGSELDHRLCEGLLLEQSGWKGKRGTAMAQDAATRGFYSELARVAADKGWLEFHFLRSSNRAVAFHYSLTYGGRYHLLKPGYDEALSDCSPGQLLTENVVEDCMARSLSEFDFLGPDMTWKRDWTNKVRPHHWLFIFGDSRLGKALHAAKFWVLPKVKQGVARWRK